MNRTDLQLRELGSRAEAGAAVCKRPPPPRQRLPRHCRSQAAATAAVRALERSLRERRLVTVCEEARCPNKNHCFAQGTATFMLMGDVCTRTCRFCNVTTGRPRALDAAEPARVASAVRDLGLSHAVLTSVNRDDLADGGAPHFAAAIRALRDVAPRCTVEVLTPDFQGDARAIATVADAAPDVFNHNVETVPRLYGRVRPGARYARSLDLLAAVKRRRPGLLSKSGLMLGLGEGADEVRQVLSDLRARDVDCVTLGQYLRPTLRHLEVVRYVPPEEFDRIGAEARELGFRHVASGPLVRSSFHAGDALGALLGDAAGKGGGRVAL